jgi:mannose-6-phosphate isomerase-like protein (cupin superfamily)
MSSTHSLHPSQIPELIRYAHGKIGHEEPLAIFGQEIFLKVTGDQTAGAFSAIEQVTSPGNGSPMHCHTREDETFQITEGSLLFVVGDVRVEVHPGDLLWAPRNISHGFVNIGSVRARATVVMSPAGMEDFFLKAAAIPGQPTPEQINTLFTEYGLQFLGPPPSVL